MEMRRYPYALLARLSANYEGYDGEDVMVIDFSPELVGWMAARIALLNSLRGVDRGLCELTYYEWSPAIFGWCSECEQVYEEVTNSDILVVRNLAIPEYAFGSVGWDRLEINARSIDWRIGAKHSETALISAEVPLNWMRNELSPVQVLADSYKRNIWNPEEIYVRSATSQR
jgi:hypothetical protein